MTEQHDIYWMERALALADQASSIGEVPVAAIVVKEGELIAEAWNQPISTCDPTAHAEVLAIRKASQAIGNYRLVDCELFVTLEPCAMCTGAIIHSRVKRLIYGAKEPKAGAIESRLKLIEEGYGNHYLTVTGGVLEERCSEKLSAFFAQRREQIKAQKRLKQQLKQQQASQQ